MRYSYSKLGGMAMIEKVGVYCRLSDEDKFKAKPKPKVEKKIIKTHEGNQKNDLDLNDGLKVD